MSRLQTALREILLHDPSAIEGLPAHDAEKLSRLLEANRLEALLYDRLKKKGWERSLSPVRHSAWKNASLLALGRSMAFRAAFDEILALSEERKIPVRPLRETHTAYHLYSRPELRPLVHLEVQVPPRQAQELYAALKSLRFFELENLSDASSEPPTPHILPTLERDGVTVKICKRSVSDLLDAPWDSFPSFEDGPFLQDTETLLILLCHEIASRKFCHSLALLHDLHWVLEKMKPKWRTVFQLARETNLSIELSLPLLVLRQVLGSKVDEGFLREIDEWIDWTEPRRKLLTKCASTAILLYPASLRIAEFLGAQIAELKAAGKSSLVGREG